MLVVSTTTTPLPVVKLDCIVQSLKIYYRAKFVIDFHRIWAILNRARHDSINGTSLLNQPCESRGSHGPSELERVKYLKRLECFHMLSKWILYKIYYAGNSTSASPRRVQRAQFSSPSTQQVIPIFGLPRSHSRISAQIPWTVSWPPVWYPWTDIIAIPEIVNRLSWIRGFTSWRQSKQLSCWTRSLCPARRAKIHSSLYMLFKLPIVIIIFYGEKMQTYPFYRQATGNTHRGELFHRYRDHIRCNCGH